MQKLHEGSAKIAQEVVQKLHEGSAKIAPNNIIYNIVDNIVDNILSREQRKKSTQRNFFEFVDTFC